jgi:fucose permease
MQSADSAPAAQTYSRQMIAVIHAGFVLTGMVTILLGPVLPALAAKWALDDEQSGYLFTAQFTGSITGVAGSSWLISRLGLLRSLAAGFVFMSVGVAALGVSPNRAGIISVFLYGIGLGLTIPATNLLISEINPARRAAALNILNFAWSVGAVAGAPVIGSLTRDRGTSAPLAGLSALLAVIAVWLARFFQTGPGDRPDRTRSDAPGARDIWRSPLIALIGALAFFYVGTENAIGGWVASYALRLDEQAKSVWAIAPSVFWGALLAGRISAPGLLQYIAGDRLVLIGLMFGISGIGLLLLTSSMAGLLAGTFITGAGFASVFPNTLATLTQSFGAAAHRAAGLVFTMTGLGGALIPWAVGFISKQYGSLRLGLTVALLANLAMIPLQVVIILKTGATTGSNHSTEHR